MRIEGRDRSVEATCVVHVEEACAVRAYQAAANAVDSVDDMFLNFGTFVALF